LSTKEDELRASLIESVREGLEIVDGALIDTFHQNLHASGLAEEDIPDELDLLCSILDKTFGTGSFTVRRAIARQLYSKMGLPFQAYVGKRLSAYVAEVREQWKI